jgi:nucleotide-binding universal stress UspA family protein
MEIGTVYVPLDGSERAARALAPASALAERCDAEVVLLATPWPGETCHTVERYLDAQVAFAGHPETRPLLVQDRSAPDAICALAAEPGAIVCMTTRGRGAAREALLGSVGEAVLRTVSRPLLFVGPSFDPEWSLPPHPVVIAGIDGSELSCGALRDAGELAALLEGRVRAVEVLRPVDARLPRTLDQEVSAGLDRVMASVRHQGVRVDAVLVDGFNPAETLTSEAALRRAGFIVLASHGRTGVARAVLGSVAVATVRRAPCPVLVSGPGVRRHTTDGDG